LDASKRRHGHRQPHESLQGRKGLLRPAQENTIRVAKAGRCARAKANQYRLSRPQSARSPQATFRALGSAAQCGSRRRPELQTFIEGLERTVSWSTAGRRICDPRRPRLLPPCREGQSRGRGVCDARSVMIDVGYVQRWRAITVGETRTSTVADPVRRGERPGQHVARGRLLRSIMRRSTLLWGDRSWMCRLAGTPSPGAASRRSVSNLRRVETD